MIGELTRYFKKNFYTDKDREITEAFDLYEKALSQEGEESLAMKDRARHTLESQLVESGQAEPESVYLNPDEFFPSGRRDDDKIDDFRRQMTCGHSGQQMLWSFAGTTGAMTILTEKHLESMGRSLDDLKPAGMLRKERARKNKRPPAGTVRLYLYGDGTSSEVYDKEKAKLRFDRMKDNSGHDWTLKGYDPNYRVEKKGWFSALDKDGQWVRVDEEHPADESVKAEEAGPAKEIRLIHTLDGPLVMDLSLLLSREEEEYYYSMDGELYGGVKNDTEANRKALEETLAGEKPVGVIISKRISKEDKDAYKKHFGNKIRFYEEGSLETAKVLEKDSAEREKALSASVSLGAYARLKRRGLGDKQIKEALKTEGESVTVPLNPFLKEDRSLISEAVSPEAEAWLDGKGSEIENPQNVLPLLTAVLPLLSTKAGSTELDDQAVLDEAVRHADGKTGEISEQKITSRCTLAELCEGNRPDTAPMVSTKSYDFFNEQEMIEAAKDAGLNEGETASLTQAVASLNMPPVDRKNFNKALSRSLSDYRAVQMSTGMTVGDLVRSVDSIAMNRPDAGRIGAKDVYYEQTLGDLFSTAKKQPQKTREISKEELYKPLAGNTVRAVNKTASVIDKPEAVLALTDELLSVLGEATSGVTAEASEEQLDKLREHYKAAGIPEDTRKEALARWKEASFAPGEFESMASRLQSSLESIASTNTAYPEASKEVQTPETIIPNQRSTVSDDHKGQRISASQNQRPDETLPAAVLTLTDELLSVLGEAASGVTTKASAKQLTALNESYEAAGIPEDTRKEALARWKEATFAPGEFEMMASRLRSSLESIERANTANSVASIEPQIPEIIIPNQMQTVSYENQTIQALADNYYKETEGKKTHVLPREELLPLIAAASAGNWDSVPKSYRAPIRNSISRYSGSAYSPVVSDLLPPSVSPQTRFGGINRTIPVSQDMSLSKGYGNLGYRYNANSRRLEALKPEARGMVAEGLGSPKIMMAQMAEASVPLPGNKTTAKKRSGGQPQKAEASLKAVKGKPGPAVFTPPKRLSLHNPGTMGRSQNNTTGPAPIRAESSQPALGSYNPATFTHTGAPGRRSAGIGQVPAGQIPAGPIPGMPSLSQGQAPPSQGMSLQPELSRMDKINAHYEADKRSLGEEAFDDRRMLARNEARTSGSPAAYGGQSQRGTVKKLSRDLLDEMKSDFDRFE